MATTDYNKIIRKYVVGFGNLFNNITLVRYNPDNTEEERILVPIAYASKEDYVQRLEGDPNLDKKVQLTLPRLSFELNGLTYDTSRKQNTNIKNFANTPSGVKSQYNPVPYNFDFNLYLYVRNIEDGTQLLEHILPFFTPDYTIKLNLVPEMNVVKEIPVILNSTDIPVDYEGNAGRDTRVIIWTLNFTVKGYIFGNKNGPVGLINNAISNILNGITSTDVVQFTLNNSGIGNYKIGELVYQGYSAGTATATATVVSFNNNILTLTNINGHFVSNLPIIGQNASYYFTSYNIIQSNMVKINTVPNPITANGTGPYIANTTITELK